MTTEASRLDPVGQQNPVESTAPYGTPGNPIREIPSTTNTSGPTDTTGATGTTGTTATTGATDSTTQPTIDGTTGTQGTSSSTSSHKEGVLGYKAPGLIRYTDPACMYFDTLLTRSSKLRYSKRFFWIGNEAVPASSLKSYLDSEKADPGHHNAAWSNQTGKGLLYYTKRSEDKATPAGVICLVS